MNFARLLSIHNPPKSDFFQNPDVQLREDRIPKQSDIVIIGGGVIGWAIAYWIRFISQSTVTVIERDPTLASSATVAGLGCLRTQFTLAENIQMSLFAADFLRNSEQNLSAMPDDTASLNFSPHGHLMLANESGAAQLEESFRIQSAFELPNKIMSPNEIKNRWSWINTEDVALASLGERNEGWFSQHLLLKRLQNKAHVFGANYVIGNVQGFTFFQDRIIQSFYDRPNRSPFIGPRLSDVLILLPNGAIENIAFNCVVNAAGPWASDIVSMAMKGVEENIVPLNVEKRKQNIFVVRPDVLNGSESLPSIDAPIIVDHSGIIVRREGLSGDFMVCMNPNKACDKSLPTTSDDLDVDYDEFYEQIQPLLAKRIPSMANAKIQSAWACFNDYNPIDQSLIIGQHPYFYNMYLANGSSGLGGQHSIAIGRAIAELIHYRHYKSLDLTRFSFDRFYLNLPISEQNNF